jgi:molecular chaperone GrpE
LIPVPEVDFVTDQVIEPATTEQPATPETVAEAPVDELADLKQELEKARAQATEYLDGWQRARAELTNYRKRVEKDQAEFGKVANSVLITRLLPVLDDFQRAFQTLPPNLRGLTWIDGIALIERKLNAILEAEGLTPIDAVGQPFDPAIHEAVMSEESAGQEDGQIIAEFQKGYKLHDRVLRPAMVKVAKNRKQGIGDQ